jgi:ribosomal protein S18 acetylase RimI-like enzyme
MASEFTIRPAGAHEMGTVAALFRDYVASLGVDLSYQGIEAELASLPGAYAPPSGALLLAVSPLSQPLGCVAMRKLTDDACEMKRLYTAPSSRGLGLGRALAMAAISAATQAGYRTMRLDTLPAMHAAQALYRDLGFEVTPPYYATPVAGTLFMRKALPST